MIKDDGCHTQCEVSSSICGNDVLWNDCWFCQTIRMIIPAQQIFVDLPKKHGRGGQSALRFARLRLEKRHNYLRKVVASVCFLSSCSSCIFLFCSCLGWVLLSVCVLVCNCVAFYVSVRSCSCVDAVVAAGGRVGDDPLHHQRCAQRDRSGAGGTVAFQGWEFLPSSLLVSALSLSIVNAKSEQNIKKTRKGNICLLLHRFVLLFARRILTRLPIQNDLSKSDLFDPRLQKATFLSVCCPLALRQKM